MLLQVGDELSEDWSSVGDDLLASEQQRREDRLELGNGAGSSGLDGLPNSSQVEGVQQEVNHLSFASLTGDQLLDLSNGVLDVWSGVSSMLLQVGDELSEDWSSVGDDLLASEQQRREDRPM